MFADKLKFLQGYVRVRLTGYAPERFLNLCSKRNILIWNLEFKEEAYELCISVKAFRELKPVLRKTKTRLRILSRHGLPFFLHRYRKRKVFFLGIVLCALSLYVMSLFIWNIEIEGNLHRTDSTILQFLEENHVYHGIRKNSLDCARLEELLRSQYDDVIWASVKIQGTRLVIDIQENLVTNQAAETVTKDTPSDLAADKDAVIYSIITRTGTPLVEKGSAVVKGDILVEGRVPIYNDNGELVHYRYCYADADILANTSYFYHETFPMEHEDKVFSGKEKTSYGLLIFQKRIRFPWKKQAFAASDRITVECPVKLGKNFYLPIVLCKEVAKEYNIEKKTYTKTEAETLAADRLSEFCKKLEEKGVHIIENHVMIIAGDENCTASGEIRVVESVGMRQAVNMEEPGEEAAGE